MTGYYPTIKEWAYCLFSKKHASSTWLHIERQDERKVLKLIDRALIVLAVSTMLIWALAGVRYARLQHLRAQRRANQALQIKILEN